MAKSPQLQTVQIKYCYSLEEWSYSARPGSLLVKRRCTDSTFRISVTWWGDSTLHVAIKLTVITTTKKNYVGSSRCSHCWNIFWTSFKLKTETFWFLTHLSNLRTWKRRLRVIQLQIPRHYDCMTRFGHLYSPHVVVKTYCECRLCTKFWDVKVKPYYTDLL